jgi:hypothetical protein
VRSFRRPGSARRAPDNRRPYLNRQKIMKILSTLLTALLFASHVDAKDFFRKVVVGREAWSVTFHDRTGPTGGRYIIKIDDTDRGLTGFLQVISLKSDEVLHLNDRHWGMDIKPVENDGKKGIEITRHFFDTRAGKQATSISFEAQHEENPKDIRQADPVAARAWDRAKSHIENGEKDKALEVLAFLQKYLSPIWTKTEQTGDGQPATKPADEVPAEVQPPPPTSKDAPR